jgi:heme/copper-type cytochrome/quinol oxidase subunit 2
LQIHSRLANPAANLPASSRRSPVAVRAWNLLRTPIASQEHAVPESVFWMVVYFGLALIAIAAVFFFAMRFVNSTRSRNVQMKWQDRRPK